VRLGYLLAAAFLLNVPFGYWRTHTRKYSPAWFLSIHAPIPFVVALRLALGFNWAWVPLLLVASVAGQYLGGRLAPRPGD